jgi:hypothetical protein
MQASSTTTFPSDGLKNSHQLPDRRTIECADFFSEPDFKHNDLTKRNK